MRRFLIELSIDTAGKKINAIKEVRRMLGMGLGESKKLVETPRNLDGWGTGPTGGTLIVNGDQVARLVESSFDQKPFEPQFTLLSVKEICEPSAIDVSGNLL